MTNLMLRRRFPGVRRGKSPQRRLFMIDSLAIVLRVMVTNFSLKNIMKDCIVLDAKITQKHK